MPDPALRGSDSPFFIPSHDSVDLDFLYISFSFSVGTLAIAD